MPINASYEYYEAEKKYLSAETIEDKIRYLRELIKTAPKHKGSENLLAELKLRLKKFLEKVEKNKKVGKGKKGIRKEGFQVCLIGKTNSGKSSLLSKVTNVNPKVSMSLYSTIEPEVGIMDFEGVKIQVVDLPSYGGKEFDKSIVHTTDCLAFVVDKLEDIKELLKDFSNFQGGKVVVFNKVDLMDENSLRKLEATLKSKKYNYVLVSSLKSKGLNEFKKKVFDETGLIRIFTKEPGKLASKDPIVLQKNSCVKDAADMIYKGFSKDVKETRLTGPSGKFSNQRVGLNHKLKDRDVIEFKTK